MINTKLRLGALNCLCKVFACALLATGRAATFFVATNGDNGNPGTEAQPWLSIQQAADTMQPGDTVIVQPGTYAEDVNAVRSGLPGSPITFLSPQGAVVNSFLIGGLNSWQHYQWHVIDGFQITDSVVSYCANTTFRNLVFSNSLDGLSLGNLARWITNGWIENVKFINVSNNMLNLNSGDHHVVTNCYFTGQNGWDAIRLNASSVRVVGNVFTNVSRPAGSDLHTDLIQAFSDNGEIATNNVIERNFAVNCAGTQIGNLSDDRTNEEVSRWRWCNNIWVSVEGAMSMYTPGMEFYNNIFLRSGTNTGGAILFRTSANLFTFEVSTVTDVFLVNTSQYPMPFVTGSSVQFMGADLPTVINGTNSPGHLVYREWYKCRRTGPDTFTLHPTAADATNDVNRFTVIDGGSGSMVVTTSGYRGNAHNGRVFNNIFSLCASSLSGSWTTNGSPTNLLSGNNLIQTLQGGADPGFINPDALDFHLRTDSVAIGAGTNLTELFTNDFSGAARLAAGAWTIGPYEGGINTLPRTLNINTLRVGRIVLQ